MIDPIKIIKSVLLTSFLMAAVNHYIAAQSSADIDTSKYLNRQIQKEDDVFTVMDTAVAISKKSHVAALQILQHLLNKSLNNNYKAAASEVYSHIVTIYNNKGLYDDAFTFIKQSEQVAHQRSFNSLLPAVYNSFANRYQRTGQYDSAMHYYYKAIAVIENNPDITPSALPSIYINMSGVLEYLGDYKKGLMYLEKAERILRNSQSYHLLCLTLINKGNALENLSRNRQSITVLEEALTIARTRHYLQWEHLSLCNLANNYTRLNNYSKALNYLNEALALKGDVDPNYRTSNLIQLASVHLALKNIDKATEYGFQGLQLAKQHSISRSVLEANRILGLIYREKGDYSAALSYTSAYASLKDSIINEDMLKRNSILEIKYRTAQMDKELAESKLEITRKQNQLRNRNFLIAITSSGLLLLAAVAALLYSMYRNNRNQKFVQEEKVIRLQQEQELIQLKSIMQGEEKTRTRIAQDLHDGIGGQLASIKMNLSAAKKEHPIINDMPVMNNIADMLAETAKEVRKTAHNLLPDFIERQSLKEALMYYCENNSTSQLKIGLQYDLPFKLPKNAELFIYRIIQELLQNIIKHSGASLAFIQLMENENLLNITVEDNGVGFDTSRNTISGSGLSSLQSRVATLNGYFSMSSSEGMGAIVHIELAINKLQNLS